MLHECAFTRRVPFVHRTDLRHRDVGFVDHQQKVLREIVEQAVRRRAGRPTVDVARIVLDARTRAHLSHHLDVIAGSHA